MAQQGSMTQSFVNFASSLKDQVVEQVPKNPGSMHDLQKHSARQPAGSPSAPTSPTRPKPPPTSSSGFASGFLNKVQSKASTFATQLTETDRKYKTLLVIDDPRTDWAKYFRARKIAGDYEIKVEQAEHKELHLVAYAGGDCQCEIHTNRGGTKIQKSFKPDFALIRQHCRNDADLADDYRRTLIGLHYCAIPTINSLHSIYNFSDRPWVYGELVKIQRKLGPDVFPLVSKTFYASYKEMQENPPNIKGTVVVKTGNAHAGLGKMKIDPGQDFSDVASLVALTNSYATVEPFIDGKFDIYIQKIGTHCKAYVRKSLSGNWKASVGQQVLEQIPMTERYKIWIDEVAQMFGGLDIAAVEAIQSKDGKEFILEAKDSCMYLLGDGQEEDRRQIAELVGARMSHMVQRQLQAVSMTSNAAGTATPGSSGYRSRTGSQSSQRSGADRTSSQPIPNYEPQPAQHSGVPVQRQNSASAVRPDSYQAPVSRPAVPQPAATRPVPPQPARPVPAQPPRPGAAAAAPGSTQGRTAQQPPPPRQSSLQAGSAPSPPSRPPSTQPPANQPPNPPTRETSGGPPPQPPRPGTGPADAAAQGDEDTMKNLKKTFAGIFGEMG